MEKEIGTFAGGCFWCTEAIFRRLIGVSQVESGYSGGTTENPSYDQVSMGNTGHAEAIQITFDPARISYETLVEIFFSLHDPTTRNQQGNDIGTQYRSAIFYHSKMQHDSAEKIKTKIEESGYYKNPIVTEIVPFTNFYKAEEYHQSYYERNKSYPYCSVVIDPKIKKLLQKYTSFVKQEYK